MSARFGTTMDRQHQEIQGLTDVLLRAQRLVILTRPRRQRARNAERENATERLSRTRST
jgi:hypothetical protein